MDVDDLVDRLAEFGVEGNEALAYYHLSRMGSSTASEVAKAADLPRTDVYRLMDGLEEKGLVERTLETPTQFVPEPIDEALERRLEARQREIERLEGLGDELRDHWPTPRDRSPPQEERVSIHKGDRQVEGLLERMIADAEDHVLVVCPKRSLARFESMGIDRTLLQRAREGLDVKVLTEVDDTNRETAERWAEDCQLRHVDLPSYLQTVAVDTKTVAQFVAVDPLTSVSRSGLTALRLTSTDFLLAQEALFDALWEQGFDFEQRARELDTGEPIPQAEVVRGSWLVFERLEAMVRGAEDTVRLAVTGTELDHPGAGGFVQQLEARADEGMDVRVLGDAPELPQALERRPGDDRLSPLVLVVEDQVLRLLETGEQAWAVWSTLPGDVDHARDRFDEAWS